MTDDVAGTTSLDADGLRIPPELREFTHQVVFRTPRVTIQHFGSDPLDPYYGMIEAGDFGDPDEFRDPRNPELAPDRVSIKPEGEEPVVLEVELEATPEVVTDGGWCAGEVSRVTEILDEYYGDRVYSVEDGTVWVSGMNANCGMLARRMAKELAHGHDIPTSLVHDDDAARFGGLEFRWGDSA